MDEYQHLRESADEATVLNDLENLGIGFGHRYKLNPFTGSTRHESCYTCGTLWSIALRGGHQLFHER